MTLLTPTFLTSYLLLILLMLTFVSCILAYYLSYISLKILLLNLSFQQAMAFNSYYFMNAILSLGGSFKGEENAKSFVTMCLVA